MKCLCLNGGKNEFFFHPGSFHMSLIQLIIFIKQTISAPVLDPQNNFGSTGSGSATLLRWTDTVFIVFLFLTSWIVLYLFRRELAGGWAAGGGGGQVLALGGQDPQASHHLRYQPQVNDHENVTPSPHPPCSPTTILKTSKIETTAITISPFCEIQF